MRRILSFRDILGLRLVPDSNLLYASFPSSMLFPDDWKLVCEVEGIRVGSFPSTGVHPSIDYVPFPYRLDDATWREVPPDTALAAWRIRKTNIIMEGVTSGRHPEVSWLYRVGGQTYHDRSLRLPLDSFVESLTTPSETNCYRYFLKVA